MKGSADGQERRGVLIEVEGKVRRADGGSEQVSRETNKVVHIYTSLSLCFGTCSSLFDQGAGNYYFCF